MVPVVAVTQREQCLRLGPRCLAVEEETLLLQHKDLHLSEELSVVHTLELMVDQAIVGDQETVFAGHMHQVQTAALAKVLSVRHSHSCSAWDSRHLCSLAGDLSNLQALLLLLVLQSQVPFHLCLVRVQVHPVLHIHL